MEIDLETQQKAQELLDNIEIELDQQLIGSCVIDGMNLKFKPLSRGLAKQYSRVINEMQENKDLGHFIDFDDLMENCLKHSLMVDVDLDGLPEPTYDTMVLYFQAYYTMYKKKSATNR